MALQANALITLQEAKDHLGITGSSYDDRLEDLINGASDFSDRYTNNNIVEDTYTDVLYDGNNSDFLLIPVTPLTAVASLYIDGSRIFDASSLVDTDDYDIRDQVGIVLFDGRKFTHGKHTVKVTYTAGYSTVPETIKLAVKLWVEYYFRLTDSKNLGLKSYSQQGDNYSRDPGLPKEIMELLDPFVNNAWTGLSTRLLY